MRNVAKPYYYKVYLAEHDVVAEITTTERAAMFRFTFPENEHSYIVVDAFDKGSGDVKAYSVYVVGKDVYVAGEEGDTAKVWKNGEELYKLTDNGEAYSMVVYNGDVYVAGEEGGTAKVWKNGQEIYSLADKGRAYSIFIAERK